MKKFFALLLALVMVLSLAACTNNPDPTDPPTDPPTAPPTNPPTTPPTDPTDPEVPVMTHEEYMAAAKDDAVCVETYVQATQSWWDNKISVYCQSPDGAYFLYELACSQDDAAKLVPGTKIKVNGFKGEWAGEIEVMDGTFEFVEGGDTWIAEPADVTELLGTEELIAHQNEKVSFTGLTVQKIEYKNGEPGDDIYVTVGYQGQTYSFCVEKYLTGPDTEVYNTVAILNVGDVVDIEGFLYWYEGVNTHITKVTRTMAVMPHDEYLAAANDDPVNIVTYVQGHQSWWDNKITVYCQSPDGAYFLYELACSEEDAAKLVPGTKIIVTGYRGEWAGEVEVMDGHFYFVEDGETWIAEAADVTALLGTEELINHQNEKVVFNGLTVEKIEYKNGEPGDDIYVTVGYQGQTYSFCVEKYLTGPDTEVYKAVGELEVGDVVNVEGFLYWYEGVNTHITAVTPAA